MNGPIGAATPLVRKPVEVVPNLDLDLKQQMKLMVVVVLAQVQWQKIATPKTVQVSIFFLLYFADLFTWKTCVMWNSLIMTKFYASKVVVKLWYPKFTYSSENFIFAVNCKWSNWRSYSSCSKTCGGGTQSRSRSKTINEANGGSCPGSSTMTRDCNTQNCPSKYLFCSISRIYLPEKNVLHEIH